MTLLLSFFLLFGSSSNSVCLSADEKKLFDVVNAYRESMDLEPVPFSAAMTRVAQAHVLDLGANYTFKRGAKCNPHSWSKKGEWSDCCYTSDHKRAACMWDKPREIAGFDTNGFEILSYSSDGVTPGEALVGWQKSKGHHDVMINNASWQRVKWQSMGVGIYEEWAVVWFGEKADSESTYSMCQ